MAFFLQGLSHHQYEESLRRDATNFGRNRFCYFSGDTWPKFSMALSSFQ